MRDGWVCGNCNADITDGGEPEKHLPFCPRHSSKEPKQVNGFKLRVTVNVAGGYLRELTLWEGVTAKQIKAVLGLETYRTLIKEQWHERIDDMPLRDGDIIRLKPPSLSD